MSYRVLLCWIFWIRLIIVMIFHYFMLIFLIQSQYSCTRMMTLDVSVRECVDPCCKELDTPCALEISSELVSGGRIASIDGAGFLFCSRACIAVLRSTGLRLHPSLALCTCWWRKRDITRMHQDSLTTSSLAHSATTSHSCAS